MIALLSAWAVTVVTAVALLTLLVVAAAALSRGLRTATQRFYCTWSRRDVTAEFLTGDGGEPVGVLSCSGLEEPRGSTCGRLCVGGAQLRPGAGERSVVHHLEE